MINSLANEKPKPHIFFQIFCFSFLYFLDAITNHYYCGFYDVKQRIAVTALEWTDKTLDQLRNNKRFHLKTVLQLAIQLVMLLIH